MRNTRMIWSIAAMSLLLLAGCVGGSTTSVSVADRDSLARVCPTPTPASGLGAILDYLETAPHSPGLDVLASEWERLNDGALICRGRL